MTADRSASLRTPATYADLERVPKHMVAEILSGELHATPRPRARHVMAASEISIDLGAPFGRGRGGPGGWWLLVEPELHLDQDVLVPDIAGWQRDRLPSIPDAAAFTLAPDWLCEVLSLSTERSDRAVKLAIYARENVRFVWLVNPDAEILEVMRLEAGRWLLLATYAADARVRAEPFDAIEIEHFAGGEGTGRSSSLAPGACSMCTAKLTAVGRVCRAARPSTARAWKRPGSTDRCNGYKMRCQYPTSIQRLNLKPACSKWATFLNPNFSCSATLASLGRAIPPMAAWMPRSRSAVSSCV